MESKEVLVILGSTNSPTGELSDISKSRLDYAASLYANGKLVLCTGGWGNHFNISKEPHAFYSKNYLLAKGIPEPAFLEFALSSHTVEDALKLKPILSKLEKPNITIITSDFHLQRVRMIFGEVLKGFSFEYMGASTDFLESEQRAMLMAHEQEAMRNIVQNGLYF
jgi:uncharacterized SAM-binding protein YcdF (DUF218 family)